MTKAFDDLTEEYIRDMFGTEEPQCFACKHYRGGAWCDAFPKPSFIPDEIFENHHDHRTPYSGDGGVLFEPKK